MAIIGSFTFISKIPCSGHAGGRFLPPAGQEGQETSCPLLLPTKGTENLIRQFRVLAMKGVGVVTKKHRRISHREKTLSFWFLHLFSTPPSIFGATTDSEL